MHARTHLYTDAHRYIYCRSISLNFFTCKKTFGNFADLGQIITNNRTTGNKNEHWVLICKNMNLTDEKHEKCSIFINVKDLTETNFDTF